MKIESLKDYLPYPIRKVLRELRRLPGSRPIVAARFHLAQIAGSKVDFDVPLDLQWADILRRSKYVLEELYPVTKGKYLFATNYGFSAAEIAYDSVMGMALRMRGAEPLALICNRALPACEFNYLGNHDPDPGKYGSARMMCNSCVASLESVYQQLEWPIVRFSDYLKPEDKAAFQALVSESTLEECVAYTYRDIKVGEQARASTLRSMLRGTLDPDNEEHLWRLRRYLLAAIYVAELSYRLLKDVKPTGVIMPHGVYVTHGTLAAVANKLGIHVVVRGLTLRSSTIMLSHGETYHRTVLKEPTSTWDRLVLTPEQSKLIDEYLDSKRTGGKDWISVHPRPIESQQAIMSELKLNPKLPIVALYTNVIWDAQLRYTENAFTSLLDWLFVTTEHFSQRKDAQLVVRIHPGEVKSTRSTRQPILGEIQKRFPTLPDNVKIIPPESDLSTYTLADMSVAGLVYGTKLAMELGTRPQPVIIAGESYCRGKGFSYDVSSTEEYLNILDRILTLPRNTPEMMARARLFAYHFYFRRMFVLPQVRVTNPEFSTNLRLQFHTLNDLRPGASDALDMVCKGIIERTPFIYDEQSGSL
jgi:hypothetical protein